MYQCRIDILNVEILLVDGVGLVQLHVLLLKVGVGKVEQHALG